MKVTATDISGVLVLEPKVFGDDRGFFFESFNARAFAEVTGLDVAFVQDNHSMSVRNVLRGLHYQLPPRAQGKLVRVVRGEVFDVAVDIRPGSQTFAQWVGVYLSAANKKQVWIPPGLAHGFLTLSETAEFLYKTTEYYSPEDERCIRWDDSDVGIAWPVTMPPVLSARDACASVLAQSLPFASHVKRKYPVSTGEC